MCGEARAVTSGRATLQGSGLPLAETSLARARNQNRRRCRSGERWGERQTGRPATTGEPGGQAGRGPRGSGPSSAQAVTPGLSLGWSLQSRFPKGESHGTIKFHQVSTGVTIKGIRNWWPQVSRSFLLEGNTGSNRSAPQIIQGTDSLILKTIYLVINKTAMERERDKSNLRVKIRLESH